MKIIQLPGLHNDFYCPMTGAKMIENHKPVIHPPSTLKAYWLYYLEDEKYESYVYNKTIEEQWAQIEIKRENGLYDPSLVGIEKLDELFWRFLWQYRSNEDLIAFEISSSYWHEEQFAAGLKSYLVLDARTIFRN